MIDVNIKVNGRNLAAQVDDRLSLADFLRDGNDLTGTHLGCEHGVCGACTVLLDGVPVRGCITLAAAADGREVASIEGFEEDTMMAVIRQAFRDGHGLQCGFCTPGMLIMVRDMLLRGACADEAAIREELSGNICRCTGYQGIVDSVLLARDRWAERQLAAG